MITVGIEDISFASGSCVLDLKDLAQDLDVDVEKYHQGLGQDCMSVPAEDEDIVTMAAMAAAPLVARYPPGSFRTLLFATETGIDNSKSAGIYVHQLLNMSKNCRVVELKQACYSATAALQLAASYVQCHSEEKVLVIASDIARYEPRSKAEPTQGCGAIAFVIGSDPKIVRLEKPAGLYTEDVMDFWRPLYQDVGFVDGKFSAKVYLQALKACWKDLQDRFGIKAMDFQLFCYHLPFTRMAVKAHQYLLQDNLVDRDPQAELAKLEPSLVYSRQVGNCYSAAAYLGLLSLLENSHEDLTNQKLALFSYGSGCVGEILTATVMPGYQKYLHKRQHEEGLKARRLVNIEEYRRLLYTMAPKDGSPIQYPHVTPGRYRLSGIVEHKRIYETFVSAQ